MNRVSLLGLLPLAFSLPAVAQNLDHPSMPGMTMPAAAGASAAAESNEHAGHDMSAMPATTAPPSAASPQPIPAMKEMENSGEVHTGHTVATTDRADVEIPNTPPPAAPKDHQADSLFGTAAMDAAREVLRDEHGGARVSKVMGNLLEQQVRSGADAYHWDGEAWFGGDIHRLVFKSEGEATRGGGVEKAELQVLLSRAVATYTDVQIGIRQDVEPANRTYTTVGVESLLPYWFKAEAALFLSTKGELLARIGGHFDLRLTNRLILQPLAELEFAAQNTRETQTGSGLSNVELGLRLRYEIRRGFAPYIGVSYDQDFGRTADYALAMGEGRATTSVVAGIRAWF
jgi:copper resistance protein B